jgi:hypothetical protein
MRPNLSLQMRESHLAFSELYLCKDERMTSSCVYEHVGAKLNGNLQGDGAVVLQLQTFLLSKNHFKISRIARIL